MLLVILFRTAAVMSIVRVPCVRWVKLNRSSGTQAEFTTKIGGLMQLSCKVCATRNRSPEFLCKAVFG